MLTPEVKKYISKSVLCWLATASAENIPKVRNIEQNAQVCMSFIDIFIQKGFQLKGIGAVIKKSDDEFSTLEKPLLEMTGGQFPFSTITKIKVEKVKPILAPRYLLFPETTEAQQIESAKKAYRV